MDKNTGLIFVNREGLLKGIGTTLKNYERCEVTTLVSNYCNPKDSDTAIREYSIYVGEEVVLNEKIVLSGKYIGCAPKEGMITIASAYDLVEPLFERYSYLEPIMARATMDMFLSDGNDIGEKIIDAAVWYEAYAPYTKEILAFCKTRNKKEN
ncbi:MAG: hypothetical protein IJA30_04225 [Bacilli bacterium]|nr:hypothetical protein [Bacilli bacterium]